MVIKGDDDSIQVIKQLSKRSENVDIKLQWISILSKSTRFLIKNLLIFKKKILLYNTRTTTITKTTITSTMTKNIWKIDKNVIFRRLDEVWIIVVQSIRRTR